MMRRLRFSGPGALVLVSTLGLFSPTAADAQSAVQLPTVAVFSVQTSVIAPDSGGGFVDRLALSARRRAYQNRRFMSRQPISHSIHSTIDIAKRLHDLSKTSGARRSASLSMLGLPSVAGRNSGHSTYRRSSPYTHRSRQHSYVLLGSR